MEEVGFVQHRTFVVVAPLLVLVVEPDIEEEQVVLGRGWVSPMADSYSG